MWFKKSCWGIMFFWKTNSMRLWSALISLTDLGCPQGGTAHSRWPTHTRKSSKIKGFYRIFINRVKKMLFLMALTASSIYCINNSRFKTSIFIFCPRKTLVNKTLTRESWICPNLHFHVSFHRFCHSTRVGLPVRSIMAGNERVIVLH